MNTVFIGDKYSSSSSLLHNIIVRNEIVSESFVLILTTEIGKQSTDPSRILKNEWALHSFYLQITKTLNLVAALISFCKIARTKAMWKYLEVENHALNLGFQSHVELNHGQNLAFSRVLYQYRNLWIQNNWKWKWMRSCQPCVHPKINNFHSFRWTSATFCTSEPIVIKPFHPKEGAWQGTEKELSSCSINLPNLP